MEIKKVEIELESICPLLMDRFDTESKAKTKEDYIREAEKKIYKNEKGEICLPTCNIKAVIREASSELGMRREGKKNRQIVRAGVFFGETFIPINKKKYDEMRADVVTRGKGDKVTRVITYRPQFNDWHCKFQVNILGIQPEFIVQCLELGGLKYGFCGFRPEFGRFIVKSWKVLK